jgi:hypothetical protein
MSKTEEPVIYMTKSDRATLNPTKVSYSPNSSPLIVKAKVKKRGGKNTKVSARKASLKGKKTLAKGKTKHRKIKKQTIAQRGVDGAKG